MKMPCKFRLSYTRSAHLPVQFDLRLSQNRERNGPSPTSPAWFGDRLSILDHAHQVGFERIHGAGERFLFIVSVCMDVREVGKRNQGFRSFADQPHRILHHKNLTSGRGPSLFRSPCQWATHDFCHASGVRIFCCQDEPIDDRLCRKRNCIPVFRAIASAHCSSRQSITLLLCIYQHNCCVRESEYRINHCGERSAGVARSVQHRQAPMHRGPSQTTPADGYHHRLHFEDERA
jgi:hypothetical protein